MKSVVTVSAILFTQQNPKKDGTYPVKLRVTYNRVRKYYRMKDLSFTIEEFERISGKAPKGENLKWKQILKAIEAQATDVVNKLNSFSFEEFEKELFGNESKSDTNFLVRCSNYITELKSKKKFGSAESYASTLKSFQLFWKRKELPLAQITPKFLNDFETYMTESGKSLNTIGIYLRNTRRLFNVAIADGAIDAGIYPFGKNKYSIPSSTSKKRALTKEDVKLIFNYPTESETTSDYSKDLFMFSYLCNGMNLSDILRLKKSQLQGDRFSFVRQKTKHAVRNQISIEVVLHTETLRIIEKYKHKSAEYVFPTLDGIEDELVIRKRIHQTIKNTNKYLRVIAKNVGINSDVTTYFARHSFATILMKSGASRELIQQSLGHADPKTTENYLGSFDYETKKKFTDDLL